MTARLNNEGNRERCQLLKQFVTCRLCRETQQNHKLNPRLFQLFSPALDHIRNICIHSLLGVLPSGYMVGYSCVHILIVKSNKTKTEVGECSECLSCCVLHTLDSCVHVQTVSFSPKSVSQRSSLPPEHPVLMLFVRWQMFLVPLSTCV